MKKYPPMHSASHQICWFILFTVVIASCKKNAPAVTTYDVTKQVTVKNVAYGTDPAQIMDVYLPAGRSTTTTKTIILVHGGSWESGDKADFDSAVIYIMAQLPDYAVFNINYRLANAGKNTYPTAVQDIGNAINFVNTKMADYSVSTQKLIMAGASAGAHLAMLQAYGKDSAANVKAVVDLFGPTDLNWMYFNHPFPQIAQPILTNFMGTDAVKDSALYAQASPINYISASSPPTIIFHGTDDPVVPIEQSTSLQAKLQSYHVVNSLVVYQGEGHGWTDANLIDTYNKIISFLKQNVQ
jgi:acetyl esterase/lipase